MFGSPSIVRLGPFRRLTVRRTFGVLAIAGAWLAVYAPSSPAASLSSYAFYVKGVSAISGANYTPVVSSEAIDLTGASLYVVREEGWGCAGRSLPTGQVYTLISTTGGLTGEFTNVPGNGVIGLSIMGDDDCPWSEIAIPQMQIEYHESGSIQTVTATVIRGSSQPLSAVAITVEPNMLVTNEPTTLTAEVSTSSGTPSGTVDFIRHTSSQVLPVSGCSSQPVVHIGSSFDAVCHAALAPATSPDFGPHGEPPLEAIFTPSPSSDFLGSFEGTGLQVEPAPTTTSVHISDAMPSAGTTVSYVAIVTPEYDGPVILSGSVEFLDNGQPIENCVTQTLVDIESLLRATCEITYLAAGQHSITAVYTGDGDFIDSTSYPIQTVSVQSKSDGQTDTTASGQHDNGTVISKSEIMSLANKTVLVDGRGIALVRLSCSDPDGCRGKAALVALRPTTTKGRKRTITLTLGSADFSTAPNSRVTTIRIALNGMARKMLGADRGRLKVSVVVLKADGLLWMRAKNVKLVSR